MRQLLREIADIGAGQGAPQGDANYSEYGTPFIKAGNLLDLVSGASIDCVQKVSEEVARRHKLKLYTKGTVLFAKSGMSCLKGYVYVLPKDAYVVSHLACITPKEDIAAYLRYFFEYNKPNRLVKDEAYPSISLADIGALEIDIKDKATRDKIISELNSVRSIIELRKQELQRLDDLIKARFVEMFGNLFDPRSTRKWPIKRIKDLAILISDGSNVDKALYKNRGEVLFLRIQNVWCNEFRLDDSVYISKIENEEYKDTSLKHGDLLITKIGRYYTADSSLGRVAVYLGEDDKANYSNNIMMIRFSKEINSEFVNALMNLDDYNRFIRRTSVGGTDKRALSKGLIANYPIVVPPVDKQNDFVSFIHQVDKSRFVEKKHWLNRDSCLAA